jgi:hypothetical protein
VVTFVVTNSTGPPTTVTDNGSTTILGGKDGLRPAGPPSGPPSIGSWPSGLPPIGPLPTLPAAPSP